VKSFPGELAVIRSVWSWRRWAYGAFLLVGVLWIPARVGFHLAVPACNTRLTLANASESMTKVPHLTVFAIFFVVTALQFDWIDWRSLSWSLLATIALGLLVEIEEGASRTGYCRLTDVLPDVTGAMVVAAFLMVAMVMRARAWRTRMPFLVLLIATLAACSGASSRARPSAPEQGRPIELTEVFCYSVCDTLEARIHSSGMVVRREEGAVVGRERRRMPRRGADTVWADRGSLDSLRGSLAVVAERKLDTAYRQGVPPCDSIVSSHTPIVSLDWTEGRGTHHLLYDMGCGERSGLLDATARYALQAALFRAVPVRAR